MDEDPVMSAARGDYPVKRTLSVAHTVSTRSTQTKSGRNSPPRKSSAYINSVKQTKKDSGVVADNITHLLSRRLGPSDPLTLTTTKMMTSESLQNFYQD